MKRWIGTLTLIGIAGMALAQAPFTIVRPADGAKVREKVHVLIPKNSVPPGGYIGVFLNGVFKEALVPPINGKYYDYTIDTKARKIADGPLKIETVLYVDFSDNPRIVDRSSVEVIVSNAGGISIPDDGLRLRYKFKPGTQIPYKLFWRVSNATITEAQNALGGTPAQQELASGEVRLLYNVENAYENNDGLIRIELQPKRGSAGIPFASSLSPTPKLYTDQDIVPIYMRFTDTGNEVFGNIPVSFPLQGTVPSVPSPELLYGVFPLPVLPQKAVRPGDSWQSRFQRPDVNSNLLVSTNSLIRAFPARGEFVGLEWEMGRPCAKIRNVISVGNRTDLGQALRAQGTAFSDDRFSVEEIVWFALDTGTFMKIQRIEQQDVRVNDSGVPAANRGTVAQGGGQPGGGARPAPAAGGARGGSAGGDIDIAGRNMPRDINQATTNQTGSRQGAFRPGLADEQPQRGGNVRISNGRFIRSTIMYTLILDSNP